MTAIEFWVAEAGGRMIAAAYATLRDDAWYLDALHVTPAYQSRKIGSELIRRCLTGTGPTTTLTVLTDAGNPVSNGLYLRFGMLPQDSTVTLDGPIGERGRADATRPTTAPQLTARPIDPERDAAALAAYDLATVGFARPTDHEFWLGVPGLEARIVERDGSARGYVYVSTTGAIGPVARLGPRRPAGRPGCRSGHRGRGRRHQPAHPELRNGARGGRLGGPARTSPERDRPDALESAHRPVQWLRHVGCRRALLMESGQSGVSRPQVDEAGGAGARQPGSSPSVTSTVFWEPAAVITTTLTVIPGSSPARTSDRAPSMASACRRCSR